MATGGRFTDHEYTTSSHHVIVKKEPAMERAIVLIVDGKRFTVTPSLFTKQPNTMLGR